MQTLIIEWSVIYWLDIDLQSMFKEQVINLDMYNIETVKLLS